MIKQFIKRKKRLFFNIGLDFFLFSLINTIFLEKISDLFSYSSLSLITISLLISYFFGRYHYFNKQNALNIKKYIAISFISGIISFSIFLVISKIINFSILINYKEIFILYSKYFSLSILFLIICNLVVNNLTLNKSNQWLILNNFYLYKSLKTSHDNYFKDKFKFINLDKFDENIENILKNYPNISGIIYSKDNKIPKNTIRYFKDKNIAILSSKNWFEQYSLSIPHDELYKNGFKANEFKVNLNSIQYLIKRIIDVIFSLSLLIFLMPLIILSCLLIYFQDREPVIYSQKRTGLNGKIFTISKIRTMKVDAEANGAQWSSRNDPRVTKIGAFLRKIRIDELPQLISVIKGEMSLIGPRPERPELEKIIRERTPFYELRFNVLPGLSGWAQVNYPYGSSIEDAQKKLSYDLFYIKNFSLLLDFIIFINTIKLILNRKGSVPLKKN